MDSLYVGAKRFGINISQGQLEKFDIYYRELVEWNERINLTAITDYEEVQKKHFLDSISIVTALGNNREGLRIIDIGTGAGLPGIPIKIIRPDIRLTLLEATTKKVKFLQYLTEKLRLDDIEIINGRAEEIARRYQYREKYDLAVSRAVAVLPVMAELVLPFCRIGGLFIAQKKGDTEQEVQKSTRAITELGGMLKDIMPVNISNSDEKRKLVIIEKVKLTPDKYPRRSGMPEKRPIM